MDTQGDAFFYAFPTATGAADAAREGQDGLRSGPIKVRMGLHTGTPHLTEEGYVGQDVHKGARIAAAGHGGQVLLSNETRESVEAEVTDLGEHRVKDFAESNAGVLKARLAGLRSIPTAPGCLLIPQPTSRMRGAPSLAPPG